MKLFNYRFQNSIENITKSFFSKIYYGSIKVTFPSGNIAIFKGQKEGYSADIKIFNYKFVSKIFKKKSVGLAESYIDGYFSTSNLTELLLLAFQNEEHFLNNIKANWLYSTYSKLSHYLKENNKKQSKKNIKFHYDLGNDFYNKWLDKSMTYSSAFFDKDNLDLYEAQINKYSKVAEALSLNENSNLLEIGCGWGGFSSFAAKNYKSKVDAITISKEQFEFTSNIIQKEGLNEKVKVIFKDYRDINKKYSNIASIEMFEAVGKKYWDRYFEVVKNSLINGGNAALQIITINENRAMSYQNQPDFIQQYIFPGGMLPSKKQLNDINNQAGLKCRELLSFGKSYAKTLSLWNVKFQSSWHDLSNMGFNLKFKRMWEFYLSYCETGFISKSTDVSHFLVNK